MKIKVAHKEKRHRNKEYYRTLVMILQHFKALLNKYPFLLKQVRASQI